MDADPVDGIGIVNNVNRHSSSRSRPTATGAAPRTYNGFLIIEHEHARQPPIIIIISSIIIHPQTPQPITAASNN